ncbi:MAG: S8 family serine peptidase [Cyclobacteriaceae bacterium]
MAGTNNNSSSIFPKYDEDRMVVILKDGLSPSGCECFRNDINKEIKNLVDKGEISEEEFAEFERDPGLIAQNVELWKNVNSEIVGRVIRSHTGQNRVGEGDFIYNYKNDFHKETMPEKAAYEPLWVHAEQYSDQEEVLIAVLDTGVNRDVIPEDYLWQMKVEDPDTHEFRHIRGVNFLVEEQNGEGYQYGKYEINDDHAGRHGTLVNALIIEQFKAAGKSVKIMNLKTHNQNGVGNLFSMVCAIRFAEKHGAKIINASWGFYSNEVDVLEPLKELITISLAEKGIFFVAAAGNASPTDDEIFLENLPAKVRPSKDARNLSDHHFFPAYFGNKMESSIKNIIVVTTLSNGGGSRLISNNQNYSPEVVDLGIVADQILEDLENDRFEIPFKVKQTGKGQDVTAGPPTVFGSSFAAAKATGKIAANFKHLILSDEGSRTKQGFIQDEVGQSLFKYDAELNNKIIDGLYC